MMKGHILLGWSPLAVGQILELPDTARNRVEHCVELISQFPRMGNRIRLKGEHRRRFLCGDYWIVYRLEETAAGEVLEPPGAPVKTDEHPEPARITIKYLRRDRGSSAPFSPA